MQRLSVTITTGGRSGPHLPAGVQRSHAQSSTESRRATRRFSGMDTPSVPANDSCRDHLCLQEDIHVSLTARQNAEGGAAAADVPRPTRNALDQSVDPRSV